MQTFGKGVDILVRCDAHARYPRDYVAALIASMHRHSADSVVVPMDTVGDTCLQRAVAWVLNTPLGSGGAAHRAGRRSGFVDHGHHAAITIAAFRAAGGYDPSFSHNEDAEFDCRLKAIGGRIFLDADIRICYVPRHDLRGLACQYYNYGCGRSRTMRRHPTSIRLRQAAVPTHYVLTVASVITATIVSPLFLVYPICYLAALGIGSLAIAWKHRSSWAFWGAPAAFVMHMAWATGFFAGLLTVPGTRWRRRGAPGGACFLAKGFGKWIVASRVEIFAEDIKDGETVGSSPPATRRMRSLT